MATGIPAQLADLQGQALEQIAALDTTDEVLARVVHHVVPDAPQVPVAAFNPAI